MIVKDLFVRNENGEVIEGYMGDDEQAKILFLLREPNSGGKRADKFWFREVLEKPEQYTGTAKRIATKYKNVLGKIAQLLLDEHASETELLKKCAYINLYPIKGLGKSSDEYKEMLRNLRSINLQNKVVSGQLLGENNYADIARNRLEIIKRINCDCIITTEDIFYVLKEKNMIKKETGGFCYGTRAFSKGIINGKTPIYEFYHPSYWISNQKLENMTV